MTFYKVQSRRYGSLGVSLITLVSWSETRLGLLMFFINGPWYLCGGLHVHHGYGSFEVLMITLASVMERDTYLFPCVIFNQRTKVWNVNYVWVVDMDHWVYSSSAWSRIIDYGLSQIFRYIIFHQNGFIQIYTFIFCNQIILYF